MGFDTRRPPLPAPTESMDESNNSGPDTEVGTTLTTRTDKTSYSIPEDGRPITISTQKLNATRGPDGKLARHGRQKSQTSLLIEYFEASKTGDKSRSKPSVRVKVTPSSAKTSRSGTDAIQITSISSDRKPSYTRRISLGGGKHVESTAAATLEGTDLSHSSDDRHPVEIELLHSGTGSDVSHPARSSRGLLYAPVESNISSMPPDSMLESRIGGGGLADSELSRGYDPADDESTLKDGDYLKAPLQRDDRSRSASRERLTQKVLEKLGAAGAGAGLALAASGGKTQRKSSRELSAKEREYDAQARERRQRRSSKSHHRSTTDDDHLGSEASYISSARSYRSGDSQASSRVTNNPKLLEMVEDTIKRMILPELNALKEDRRQSSGSSPNNLSTSASKPKVVLNRDGENPGTVLSRGDSERIKVRKSSSREDRSGEHRRSSSRKSSGRHSTSRRTSYEDYASDRDRERHGSSHKARDALAAAAVGGALTAAALKHHDSQSDIQERAAHRKRRSSKSRGSRSRSASITEAAAGEEAGYHRKEHIPPLPMASRINDSDLTRDSLRSSRGSLATDLLPGTPPPTRGSKSRTAALAKSLEQRHMDADGYGSPVSAAGSPASALHHQRHQQLASPTQSVSSLKKTFEEYGHDKDEPLVPRGLQTRASRSSAAAAAGGHHQRSQSSLRSQESSPTAKLLAAGRSRGHSSSRDVSMDDIFATPMEQSHAEIEHDHDDEEEEDERGLLPSGALTPIGAGILGAAAGETADEWFARQHAVNDHYRDSLVSGVSGGNEELGGGGRESNRDSYQTNPFPQDERRFTTYTEDSLDPPRPEEASAEEEGENPVHPVAANKGLTQRQVVRSPHPAVAGVESAVASLMEPSTVSSNLRSTLTNAAGGESTGSPAGNRGSYSDRMAEHLRAANAASPPALYEGSTLSQTMPSQDRWAALRMSAHSLGSAGASPAQSPAAGKGGRLDREISSSSLPRMSASGIPRAGDPLMPEIGHYDEAAAAAAAGSGSGSDLTTNPSIIQGPLGGDPTGKSEWPYTPEPAHTQEAKKVDAAGLGMAAAAAALAGAGVAMATRNSNHSDDPQQRYTPDLGRNHRHLAMMREEEAALRRSPAGSPAAPFRDEGYITDAHTLSRDALTPEGELLMHGGRYNQHSHDMQDDQPRHYGKEDLEAYARAMDAHGDSEDEEEDDEDLGGEALPPRKEGEDPFTTTNNTARGAAAAAAAIGGAAGAALAAGSPAAAAAATPSPGPPTAAENAADTDDPLAAHVRRARHFSANSHGMGSPLYDGATGAGKDRIQSRDIVALMDHLTVRDAQRNARDTEILVTLVRSAAEMRQSFDEMKRFIVEQDQLIMRDAQRNGEVTAQRVLQGPRPLPGSGAASPRTPRRGGINTTEEDAVQAKRKGVLRRALKGLTGGKSANDLVRIEDMLMQILDNVEDLKQQGGGSGGGAGTPGAGGAATPSKGLAALGGVPPPPPITAFNAAVPGQIDPLSSYEKLRGAPDYGASYDSVDRDGAATPTQAGQYALSSSAGNKQQFHSGYDGRRGSATRVSTVLEDDEDDDLLPHEAHVLDHQFENNERMLTPTQEVPRPRGGLNSPAAGGGGAASAGASPEKHRKTKSNGSGSLFGIQNMIPKVSRWSKTTASSAAPDLAALDSPQQQARGFKAPSTASMSEASRSGSALGRYAEGGDGVGYALHDDDRLRSTQSLAQSQQGQGHPHHPQQAYAAETRSMRSQGSRLTRTPSPLIPSEASRDAYDDDDEGSFDDPKYQAHRNSLLLEHPQPRQGPTGRYQNALESQAHQYFDDTTGTNSDVSQRTVSDFDPAGWGSSGTAGLARHKLTNFEPISPVSMNSPSQGGGYGGRYAGEKDDGPLVPQTKAAPAQHQQQQQHHQEEEEEGRYTFEPDHDWEPQFSNSGFSKGGGYYSSPYGSGHLLEPIEEVRYSLETDRSSHVSIATFP